MVFKKPFKKCYQIYGNLIFPTPTFKVINSKLLRKNALNWKKSPTTTIFVVYHLRLSVVKYWVQQRIYWKFIWIAPLFPHQHVFIFKKIIESNECRLHSNIYLCHKCSTTPQRFERVSFKSAKYQNTFEWMTFDAIPQNVLIKFVRNTPTLKWFRSDLPHHENIAMLRSEQDQQEEFSKIQFVQ